MIRWLASVQVARGSRRATSRSMRTGSVASVQRHRATKQILDQWGSDGWELVSVLPGPTGEQHVAYLKRQL